MATLAPRRLVLLDESGATNRRPIVKSSLRWTTSGRSRSAAHSVFVSATTPAA